MIKNSLNLHFMFAKDSKKIGALKMRKILIPFLLLALSLSFYACKKEVLGTVEGKEISLSSFKKQAIQEFGFTEKELTDENLRALFKDYHAIFIFYKEAQAQGFLDKPEIKERNERRRVSFIKSLLNQMLWEKVIQPKLKVEDKEYLPYQEKRKVRHILLLTEGKNKDKVLAQIVKVKEEISQGLDFAEAAKKYSEDPGTKEKGGDLEWINYASPLVANFQKGAMEAKVNEVTNPIETEYGYHLILVEEIQTNPIDEIKKDAKITELLERKKALSMAEEYMNELRTKYQDKIHFYPERIKDVKKNGKLDLYRVDDAGFMTVEQAAELMGPELKDYQANPSKMIPTIQKRLIDTDLRYLEGVALGFDKEKDIIAKAQFDGIIHLGQVYEGHVRQGLQKKLLNEVKEEEVKAFYEKNKENYAEPIEGAKPEEGKEAQVKILPYEKAKEWVKTDFISQNLQKEMGIFKNGLFTKYKIEFQD